MTEQPSEKGFFERAKEFLGNTLTQSVQRDMDRTEAQTAAMREAGKAVVGTAREIPNTVRMYADIAEDKARELVKTLGIQNVDVVDFGKGFAKCFEDRGENLGIFIATLQSYPVETLKIIGGNIYKFIKYAGTHPKEASALGYNFTKSHVDTWVDKQYKADTNTSFDVGRLTASVMLLSTNFSKLGWGVKAASSAVRLSSFAPDVMPALDDPEKIKGKVETTCRNYLNKRLSSNPELQQFTEKIIDKIEETFTNAPVSERNEMIMTFFEFVRAAETEASDIDFERILRGEKIIIDAVYTVRNDTGNDQQFIALLQSLAVSPLTNDLPEAQKQHYQKIASTEFKKFLMEGALFEAVMSGNYPYATLKKGSAQLTRGEIPDKDFTVAVAAFATKFPFYLREKGYSVEEQKKICASLDALSLSAPLGLPS